MAKDPGSGVKACMERQHSGAQDAGWPTTVTLGPVMWVCREQSHSQGLEHGPMWRSSSSDIWDVHGAGEDWQS